MDNQLIVDRLNLLQLDYVELVKSDFISSVAEQLSKIANLNDEQTDVLVNGITLFLLFFIDLEELVDFISTECGINHEQAAELTFAFKATLPDGYSAIHFETLQIFTNQSSELESEIAETEAALEQTEVKTKFRTMTEDMRQSQTAQASVVPTYTSTQADLLTKTPTAVPHWESET